ncbi:hypothetical protein V502_00717 [Pseudogymnoascus sp. VKM F-4520 (FW-2644)]|nr:hypothetical protein V502_00717 [Pseudogymnoascus sp. VKM F-4520 (FW-2644)]
MTAPLNLLLALLAAQWGLVQSASPHYTPNATQNATALPYDPRPAPAYMVDNQHNYFHTAPDKGKQNGPVWRYSGSLDKYMTNLRSGTVVRGGYAKLNGTRRTTINAAVAKRQSSSDYWLSSLGSKGAQPLAGGDDYQFFRNVVDDFGADNSGDTDTSEALNAAVASWNKDSVGGAQTRCGEDCGNTFSQGAIVYFPPGTYKICSPVIQYYYTQFIGDPNDMPTIKGCDTFQGIAMFDTDPYIPGGSGSQWYVNQNQFFRQIRNFIFDLNDMPESTAENDQDLVPTGIHWQVAQATSLQNLVFKMPTSSTTTAVGIFSENGSGGFVSDLEFNGGNIGWRAGSQQYTARNLQFNSCNTAVQMVWDWGWNWQQIEISGGSIAFNISGTGGDTGQGTGSVSIIDTIISGTTVGILTNGLTSSPNIVLDNTVFKDVDSPVMVDGGSALLSGSSDLWATGKRYNGSVGSTETGDVTAPAKAKGLLDSETGFLYVRSRPQYEDLSTSSFLVATTDGGCKNDGTGDQTSCINSFLKKAVGADQVAYFPAGIYTIGGTVLIPTGSRVQGSSWSQIQGSGFYFSDMNNPKVMVQVGNKGDVGTMEIVEMLFSVRGATAGAVLMEWNTAASEQGAAAMWDSHFRVGGALGSDLDFATCPKFSSKDECIAASLLFHVTTQGNGYFENVWAWVGDHDNDASVFNQPDSTITQITVYGARGTLIESHGPSWFYGSGSEHTVLYNYLLSGAKNIYMGHIQTESPYYQPVPGAPAPFGSAASFPNDPDFSQCNITANTDNEQCRYSWGLQIIDSSDVTIHSAGLYSFFNAYYQDCIDTHNCQERVLEVKGSTGVAIYNLFTVAIVDAANGIDGSKVPQADTQRGFTTEISVWLPLPGGDNIDIVWVGTEVWDTPTVTCSLPPCMLIIPTSSLAEDTTITPSKYTTSFEYGGFVTTTIGGIGTTVFVTSTTTVTISIPSIVTNGIGYSNVNVTATGPTPVTIHPSIDIPPIGVTLPDGDGGVTTRTITLPPWPQVNGGPTVDYTDPGTVPVDTGSSSGQGKATTYYTPIGVPVTVPGATVTTLTFPASTGAITISCPAETSVVFATPAIAVATTCTNSGSLTFNFVCPTTKVVTFLASTTAMVSVDCSLVTTWSTGQPASTTTPLPIWATWPIYGQIIPVTTSIDKPQPTDDGVVVPCKAWFFFICISWGELHINAWHWVLPPGIYGPGPPPIGLIKWPPGINIKGNLPNWPKITIGRDNQITTEEEGECETQTAEACTTTTYVSADSTLSSASMCETISGCSISVSDSSTTVIGTQTPAPIGTWHDEFWATMTLGDAYSNSVYDALSAEMARDEASGEGTTISFTSGPTAGPTCAGATTACGARAATRRPRQPSAARRRQPNRRPAPAPPPTCATATRAGATRARRTAAVTARAVPMCAPSPASATAMRAGATRARRIAAATAPAAAPRSRPQRQRLSTRAPTSIVERAGRRLMMRAASRIVQVNYQDCRRGNVDFSSGSRDTDGSVEGRPSSGYQSAQS